MSSTILRPSIRYFDSGNRAPYAFSVHGDILIQTVPAKNVHFTEPGVTVIRPLAEALRGGQPPYLSWYAWDFCRRHILPSAANTVDLESVRIDDRSIGPTGGLGLEMPNPGRIH